MSKSEKQIKPLRLPTCIYCDLPFDHAFDEMVTPETQRLFTGYQPCDKCKESITKGFLVMGVSETETFPNQPFITEQNGVKLYPTQNIIVLSNEVKQLLKENDPNLAHITDETPGAYMPDQFVKELIEQFEDQLVANNSHSEIKLENETQNEN